MDRKYLIMLIIRAIGLITASIALGILLALLNSINIYAAHTIEQRDLSKVLSKKYTIKKRIKQKIIDGNMKKAKEIMRGMEYIKDINIRVIFSEHYLKEVYGLTSKIKIKDDYVIIMATSQYRFESTFLHELGHIIQFKYINLESYRRICYRRSKRKDLNFTEEFADDFRYFYSNKLYKKRSNLKYSYVFPMMMKSLKKRIDIYENKRNFRSVRRNTRKKRFERDYKP